MIATRRPRGATLALAILAAGMLGAVPGCCVPKYPVTRPASYYAGPTETLETLVEQINRNNAALPTLWTNLASFQAWVIDDDKKERYFTGDGVLMYRARGEFWLQLNDAALGPIMTLGTEASTYWLIVRANVDTMWWGRTKHVGSQCARAVPVDPTLVAQVLGVGRIETDFLKEPVPVLRFDNDSGAYVLTWNARAADRWVAQREVWYDRETFLPFRVLLYGDRGRVLLRAELAEHVAVKTEAGAEAGGRVAGAYTLSFPDTNSRMILRLDGPLVTYKGRPRDESFVPPLARPGVGKVIQVDEACGP